MKLNYTDQELETYISELTKDASPEAVEYFRTICDIAGLQTDELCRQALLPHAKTEVGHARSDSLNLQDRKNLVRFHLLRAVGVLNGASESFKESAHSEKTYSGISVGELAEHFVASAFLILRQCR